MSLLAFASYYGPVNSFSKSTEHPYSRVILAPTNYDMNYRSYGFVFKMSQVSSQYYVQRSTLPPHFVEGNGGTSTGPYGGRNCQVGGRYYLSRLQSDTPFDSRELQCRPGCLEISRYLCDTTGYIVPYKADESLSLRTYQSKVLNSSPSMGFEASCCLVHTIRFIGV